MKKIGFYGGTFNPIHFGHINLAIELLEREELDEVWFCPANQNPHRVGEKMISVKHRLEMTCLATEEIPSFFVIENELYRKPPSYTVDTLEELNLAYSEHRFFLLLGEDAASSFSHWFQPNRILELAEPLIGLRQDRGQKVDPLLTDNIVLTREFAVSATEIRNRLQNRLYCGHLVPSKVLDYICKNQLYCFH